jgi:hypothetical protein
MICINLQPGYHNRIVTKLRAGQPKDSGSPAGRNKRSFFSLQNAKGISGAHLASYLVVVVVPSLA